MIITNSYLKQFKPQEAANIIIDEYEKICNDPVYFIENYILITDINKQGEKINFNLYEYQQTAAFQFQSNYLNLTMKTRQTGLTTFSQAFTVWWMITKDEQICKCIANRKEISKKFLKGVRDMLDNARELTGEKKRNKFGKEIWDSWLIPQYEDNNNAKESFGLKNGSNIKAEGNSPEAGRGDSLHLCIIDEVASIDYQRKQAMEDIWASVGPALTRSKGTCICISTPKGKSGWYFDQYINAEEKGWKVLNASWTQHPIYNLGMYQWIKDDNNPNGGYIKFYNENWQDTTHPDDFKKYKSKETYEFIKDGKIRSPWYDVESRKLGKQRTLCELDCSFSGSGGEVIDNDILVNIKEKCKDPIRIGLKNINNTFSDDLKNSFEKIYNAVWKNYYVYVEPKYIDVEKDGVIIKKIKEYILICDIATGDGSDSSSIVVMDVETNEICATFKDSKISPDNLAYVCKTIANEYGECEIVIENNGPGLTCLLKLQNELNYPDIKIYKSKLKKTDPNEKDGKKSKLGFWQSNFTRQQGGDVLEEFINNDEIVINCKRIYKELETWVWRDGRRDHLPGKHDDLIMALTMYCYIRRFVKEYYGVKVANVRRVQARLIKTTKFSRFSSLKKYDADGFPIE